MTVFTVSSGKIIFSCFYRNMMKEPPIKAASLAEEELARVRSAFVWRVSTEILKQLLEALVSDGVLNELEKESILEKNPVRADKARCFIDTVRKKGDKASRTMIRYLQTIDLSLFSQLRLYSDSSAQQGEVTFFLQEWSLCMVY
uniref:CARD domain-containing protein n=2 Tax=Haplochromini TaxID=319058 RepID=A0A3Q2VIG5_HAPBU